MNIIDIIEKKKKGLELSESEINYFIEGVTNKTIPDYQISALLMAIYFKSMSDLEIINLTKAMVNSGDVINLDKVLKPTIDKHSTGGVGDKTSLVLGPLMATYDLAVAKMSGRGLGHTGGTLDKLEAIEGFEIEITDERFIKQVNEIGVSIIGQTKKLVPADKALYAMRDVTGTVDSIPLIASSIMSKKIASGAHTIILDVKYGNGAFMKTKEDAEILASKLVMIGEGVGRKTIALISNMNQPLGLEIGNANEILEVIETLKGHGPSDLRELCEVLAVEFLLSTKIYNDYNLARQSVREKLQNGMAYKKFTEMVVAQSGSVDALNKLKKSPNKYDIFANESGYICEMDAIKIGRSAMYLGAGREKTTDIINHEVSATIYHKVGYQVNTGDLVATLYYDDATHLQYAVNLLTEAIVISENQVEELPVIDKIIGGYNK